MVQEEKYQGEKACDVRQLMLILTLLFFFFYLAFTTLYEFEPPHSGGSEITQKDAPQSVRLLWTSDQPVSETCT
jgi:hypothetical protein